MNSVASRVGAALAVLIVASIAVFSLLHLASGNPASVLAGQDASPAQVAAVSRSLGLDQSLPYQYWHWITGLITGKPGNSYILKRSIASLIAGRLGSTVQLMVAATLIMVVLGVLLGGLAASTRRRALRGFVDAVSTVALAAPPFVTGILLIFLLAVTLPWLPAGGQESFLTDPSISVQYLIMPAFAAALPGAAVVARLLATEMRRSEREQFTRTAWSKGAGRLRVMAVHVFPNSIGPAAVEVGIRIGELFAGAVVVESIFARNGIGSLLVTAVEDRDYLLAQDLLLLAVAFAIVMQLLTELGMSRVDARLRTA